jgi:hypothetical protein
VVVYYDFDSARVR